MTIHQPPRLATWILKRLGSTIIEDALVGDLFEAYQTRRSPFWYWREVGVAIGVGACRDVCHHLPVALGAIVTGLSSPPCPSGGWSTLPPPRGQRSPSDVDPDGGAVARRVRFGGSERLAGKHAVPRTSRGGRVVSRCGDCGRWPILLSATNLGPLALGGVLVLDALAAVAGGSLTSVREKTVRG